MKSNAMWQVFVLFRSCRCQFFALLWCHHALWRIVQFCTFVWQALRISQRTAATVRIASSVYWWMLAQSRLPRLPLLRILPKRMSLWQTCIQKSSRGFKGSQRARISKIWYFHRFSEDIPNYELRSYRTWHWHRSLWDVNFKSWLLQ